MKTKKKKLYHGRDYLKLELIKGATKANIQPDQKKKANREKCREKVRIHED